ASCEAGIGYRSDQGAAIGGQGRAAPTPPLSSVRAARRETPLIEIGLLGRDLLNASAARRGVPRSPCGNPGRPAHNPEARSAGTTTTAPHTGAAPSPDRHTPPPNQPPRPARRPTPPRGPASRLALDDGAGGGRCLRPDEAHTFAVSGYVIPGVPGSPGAIPV